LLQNVSAHDKNVFNGIRPPANKALYRLHLTFTDYTYYTYVIGKNIIKFVVVSCDFNGSAPISQWKPD
jgi:hypothetical protein